MEGHLQGYVLHPIPQNKDGGEAHEAEYEDQKGG